LTDSTLRRQGERSPVFSIVIPTYSRPAALRACLEGIAALDFDFAGLEVIVVNDGGLALASDLRVGLPGALSVEFLSQPRGGPGSARNAGAVHAHGRYLAFIDDDCVPTRGWLRAFERTFATNDRSLLGGRVENALTDNPYADASERISQFVYDHSRTHNTREPFFPTNNIALRLDLFRSLGGFATNIPGDTAEDKEFCDRWRAAGLTLVHTPDAVVHHAHHLTFRRFVRQHFHYGRGILAFRLMRRRREERPLVPEPSRFYVDLVRSGIRSHANGGLRASALIAVAQVSTAVGAAYQLIRWPLDRPAVTPTVNAARQP